MNHSEPLSFSSASSAERSSKRSGNVGASWRRSRNPQQSLDASGCCHTLRQKSIVTPSANNERRAIVMCNCYCSCSNILNRVRRNTLLVRVAGPRGPCASADSFSKQALRGARQRRFQGYTGCEAQAHRVSYPARLNNLRDACSPTSRSASGPESPDGDAWRQCKSAGNRNATPSPPCRSPSP